jgi:chromosomal replication initiation ATPase DnaA
LSHVFAARWEGDVLAQQPDKSAQAFFDDYTAGCIAFDTVSNFDEQWLFNAFNILKSRNARVLFTTAVLPVDWRFSIKDFDSRLRSTAILLLEAPDDALLMAVIKKRLSDMGVLLKDEDAMYIQRLIPRTFASINSFVAELDKVALATKRKISRKLIRSMLLGNDGA